jgi:hypothetical protein
MHCFVIRKWLFDGTVASNKKLYGGTVPSNKKLYDGTHKKGREAWQGRGGGDGREQDRAFGSQAGGNIIRRASSAQRRVGLKAEPKASAPAPNRL